MVDEEALGRIKRLEARVVTLEEEIERTRNPKKLTELAEKIEDTERQLRKALLSVESRREAGTQDGRREDKGVTEDARPELDRFLFPKS